MRAWLVYAENNTKRVGLRSSGKTVPVEGIPLCHSAMDVLERLAESRDGSYILVVTDLLTNWVCELFAMLDQTAQTVGEYPADVIERYSIPAGILSHNGTNLKSYMVDVTD